MKFCCMSSRNSPDRFSAILFLALLSGCATLPFPAEESPELPATAAISAESFRISGRVGVTHDGQHTEGALRWQHAGDLDEIFILSPLGQGVARIVRQPGEVTLETASGEMHRAKDVESLTGEVLGWRFPADNLQHWIVGRAAPGATITAETFDGNRLRYLEQDGWRVDFVEYQTVQGAVLPRRLDLESLDHLKVRLMIDTWAFP